MSGEKQRSHIERISYDWDRLTTLTVLSTYSLMSLFGTPIRILTASDIPIIWIDLLMIELLVGCLLVVFGIIFRYYKPQFIGGVISLFAIAIQFVIGVLVDGFTSGDLFTLALFFSILSTVRRVRWKHKTTNEILRVHEIVDQVAKEIKSDQNGAGATAGDER